MIKWNHPESLAKTSFETHPVKLPFLGGRVEVVNTDRHTGARLQRPLIHLHAEAVDCDWRVVLQGDAGTQADAGLMPQNVRAMDKNSRLVFADKRRFELLTCKREPITDAAQAARAVRFAAGQTKREPAKNEPRKRRPAVTLKDAGKICNVTERTIQEWEKGNGTPEGWPGRGDPVALRAFASRRTEQRNVKRALLHTVGVGAGERLTRADRQHQKAQEGFRRCAMPLKQDDSEGTDED